MKTREWQIALIVFLSARIVLTGWAILIAALFPIILKNLDLYGTPVLAVFDLNVGNRYAYSRQFDNLTLTFRPAEQGFVTDTESASVWSLQDGHAVSGKYSGQSLANSTYPAEDIFPYRGVVPEQNLLLSVWQRFDTNWYLQIAQRGYSPNDGSTVYFPLYPFLIRALTLVVGNSMLAALLISNISLVGALAMLVRLTDSIFGSSSAKRASVYWVLFPAAFFLSAAYTESLFLFLALAAIDFARRDNWAVAVFFGVLAALARLQGVLLIIPLGWMCWVQSRSETLDSRQGPKNSHQAVRYASLLLIPIATLAFLLPSSLSLLSSYVDVLHARFVFPWDNLAVSIGLLVAGNANFVDVLNLLTTLGFALMLIPVWRLLPREYGLYSVTMFFAPVVRMTTAQPLVSMDRYVLAIFPVFMLWGFWGKNAWVNRVVVYISFPLQLFLCAQFVMWGWVG